VVEGPESQMEREPVVLPYAAAPRPRTGLATAAMTCGILGLLTSPVFVIGLTGLILGLVALRRAKREPGVYGGREMARSAIWTSAISLALGPTLLAILQPLPQSRVKTEMLNLWAVGRAASAYGVDYNTYPPDLQTLVPRYLSAGSAVSPMTGRRPPACDYFYVAGLSPKDPGDWVVAWSDPQNWGGSAGAIVFLDGSVRTIPEKGEGEFSRTLREFKAAYEQKYGREPTIVAPR
jgi:hypothetical protein